MKKNCYSFRAVRNGSLLHRFFLGKKAAKHSNRSRTAKAMVAIAATLGIQAAAVAQCNTFTKAPEANPIKSLVGNINAVAGFAFADIDADGDQDVYVNYSKGAKTIRLFQNTGSATHPVYKESGKTGFGNIVLPNSGGYMQFADIDGDGDLDYFTSTSAASAYDYTIIKFYRNTGTPASPRFEATDDALFNFIASFNNQPFTLADVDGDGDLDIYAGATTPEYYPYWQRVYFNTGSAQNPVFSHFSKNDPNDKSLGRTYYDWNKDGLLDYFTLPLVRPLANYYRNVGPQSSPAYVLSNDQGPVFSGVAPYRMIDLNNDGAPEVFDLAFNYAVLTPQSVIKDSLLQSGKTALYSKYQGAGYQYRWELNGATLAGSTGYYIIPKQSGTYTLYVTNSCGTGISLNYNFTKTAALTANSKVGGIAGESMSVSIKAYPNPFTNVFTLQLPGKSCVVKVADMAGRILLSQSTSAVTWQFGRQLKAGTYTVQVWMQDELVYRTTIVKQ